MKGLYKNKYLIAFYGANDFPIFVASSRKEFAELYAKYTGTKAYSSATRKLYRDEKAANNIQTNVPRVILIEADTVTDDCFKEADEDFIKFVNSTATQKTISERIKEAGISRTTFYRKLGGIRHDQDNRR